MRHDDVGGMENVGDLNGHFGNQDLKFVTNKFYHQHQYIGGTKLECIIWSLVDIH